MKQKFQFGGIGALFGHEIDLLVTPDPLLKPGLRFAPVFDYEQVLVVHKDHAWSMQEEVRPEQLTRSTSTSAPANQTGGIDYLQSFIALARQTAR